MIEVDRPDRKARRFQGKSDPIDAIAAAKSALAGERTGIPKRRDGSIEALRNLRVARRSAVDQRADAQRQIKALIVTAPDELRERLRGLGARQLIANCASLRPDRADASCPATAAKIALRSLARRHQQLSAEIADLDELLEPLVAAINPRLVAANAALYRVVLCRLRWDPRTRAYMERRTKDGLSKKEIIRCLKRYVARELYQIITSNDLELAA